MLAALALALAALSVQDRPDPVFSGPQPGESTPGFVVLALHGPDEGQRVDYVERWGGAPTLFVFVHRITRPVGRLVRGIDEYARTRRDRFRTLFVPLAADTLEGELNLPRTLKSIRLQSPCGVSVDGIEGPGAWGLNKDVAITAVLANEGRVVANWALVEPNETDLDAIRAETERLPAGGARGPEPRLETLADLRAELLRQRERIRALEAEVARLRREREAGHDGRMPGGEHRGGSRGDHGRPPAGRGGDSERADDLGDEGGGGELARRFRCGHRGGALVRAPLVRTTVRGSDETRSLRSPRSLARPRDGLARTRRGG